VGGYYFSCFDITLHGVVRLLIGSAIANFSNGMQYKTNQLKPSKKIPAQWPG
jgi:hypothetical protein